MRPISIIESASLIFWDFDGTIKESLDVKGLAYTQLFSEYGPQFIGRIRRHHECNPGMSRFEKIPIYLSWCGEKVTTERVKKLCDQFSEAVVELVIMSPWVPGVEKYLKANSDRQYFVLVTATPQDEIDHILSTLDMSGRFREVYGFPNTKRSVIASVLTRLQYPTSQTLAIGDGEIDLQAACENAVKFILRRNCMNLSLVKKYDVLTIDNFEDE